MGLAYLTHKGEITSFEADLEQCTMLPHQDDVSTHQLSVVKLAKLACKKLSLLAMARPQVAGHDHAGNRVQGL